VKLLRSASDLPSSNRKVCAAIGTFDGVHLGHQQVIRQTIADAEQCEGIPVVITFDRHPASVVAPHRAPDLIYPLSKKLRVIESLGVHALLLIRFDRAFSERPASDFIHGLIREFGGLNSLCVGSNFTFGHGRSGNVDLLKQLGSKLGFTVHGMASVSLDGQVVSSTRVREAIRLGHLDAASQRLGRPYELCGEVIHGDGLGTRLGIPTANLDVTGLSLPPTGVYAVHPHFDGVSHRGVLNLGFRPTLQDNSPTLRAEVHLLDFTGDLYGRQVDLTFVDKLRDEQKFRDLTELKEQIHRDIATARERF
jgi:riboflavin kinase/FMN adenylyltransferase